MKSRQVDMAERNAIFGSNPVVEGRGKALGEAVRDALLRRYETWEGVAAAISAAFGYVSAAIVKAAFSGAERNYWRGEWVALVADDPDVRAASAPPPRDPAAELGQLREYLARHYPKALDDFDRRQGRLP